MTIGLTLTSNLNINIQIINPLGTIYLPSLKFLGHSILELSIAHGVGDGHYEQTKILMDQHVQSNMQYLRRGHNHHKYITESIAKIGILCSSHPPFFL